MNSSYGYYSINTTASPDSLANTMMNSIFWEVAAQVVINNIFPLSAEDYSLMMKNVMKENKPDENLIKLFKSFE
jgi:hypothetical protein